MTLYDSIIGRDIRVIGYSSRRPQDYDDMLYCDQVVMNLQGRIMEVVDYDPESRMIAVYADGLVWLSSDEYRFILRNLFY